MASNEVIFSDCKEIYSRKVQWEKLYGKNVLITGAYGMLASYMTDMLIYLNEYQNAGITIIAIVRSEDKCKLRFREYAERPYFIIKTSRMDLPIDIDIKIDFIIHAASLASPQYYRIKPIEVIMPNAVGTYNLLNLAVSNECKGFLLFSTGSVYGKVNGSVCIAEDVMGLIDPLDIRSCYSESKRFAETLCKAYWIQKNVPTKIVRIFHTYAPTMDYQNDSRVFASFVNDIVNHRDIVIKSDGLAKRSFCYITDAVVGFFLVLLEGNSGEAYNVCNEKEWYSIWELAEIMTRMYQDLGLKVIKMSRNSNDPYVENRSASDIPPCSEKLRRLGWKAKIGVQEGFKRVIDYCRGE